MAREEEKGLSGAARAAEKLLPAGLQHVRERRRRRDDRRGDPRTYTPGETGQPDPLPIPDAENPQGVQGGRGPLNQEGEGERQNDQLAELEQVNPGLNREKKGSDQP